MIDLKNLKPPEPLPPRIIVYGEPKVGKSTFVSGAPAPIFADCEQGHEYLARSMGKNYKGVHINSYTDMIDLLLALNDQEHEYKTLVIDTIDWLEKIIHQHIIDSAGSNKDNRPTGITDPNHNATSYGKGYEAAAVMVRRLCEILDGLRRKKKLMIVLVAHSVVKKREEPGQEPYDRFIMKLHQKAESIWREWADMLIMARTEQVKTVSGKEMEPKRILILGGTKSAEVGTRCKMPHTLPYPGMRFQTPTNNH